jgi:phenylalanyl-tRNA synthetase alpha chain
MDQDLNKIIESLSPLEQKILPHLKEKEIKKIIELSGLDKVSIIRGLEFLNTKKIIKLRIEKAKLIDLDTNGIYYKKKGLPERQLILLLEKGNLSLENAEKLSKLSKNEFRAAIGALKKKALLDIKNGTLILTGNKEEITKKSLEEQFLETLPKPFTDLQPEEQFALKSLKERKEIIQIEEKQIINYNLTDLGEKLIKEDISFAKNLLEELTPEMLKSGSWKGKKFRRYDVISPVPKIHGGKRHFVNQSIDYGRKVWSELGFKEMTGNLIQSSFWNFDALFTAQDHPVREMQDTFFLDKSGELPDKKIVGSVKKAHEGGIDGSRGWQYDWSEEEAKKLVLRAHTTPLSAQTLYELSKLPKEQRKGKFFAIGWSFRNETVDWNHGFELLQTEGIVVDRDVSFRNLLGYLTEFAKKMGFDKIRFRPAYFPYTEPSVEGDVWVEEKKQWVEYIAAGVFRPEVVVPLLGENIPVLAWGPGFGRMLIKYYGIGDLRELQKNDLKQLREIKFWNK